jgi:hypothetical protein
MLPSTMNPLPVCRLRVIDETAVSSRPPPKRATAKRAPAAQPELFIQNPYLFCMATLCRADTHEAVDEDKDGRLKGNTVSSIVQLKDGDTANGDFTGFFVFRECPHAIDTRRLTGVAFPSEACALPLRISETPSDDIGKTSHDRLSVRRRRLLFQAQRL